MKRWLLYIEAVCRRMEKCYRWRKLLTVNVEWLFRRQEEMIMINGTVSMIFIKDEGIRNSVPGRYWTFSVTNKTLLGKKAFRVVRQDCWKVISFWLSGLWWKLRFADPTRNEATIISSRNRSWFQKSKYPLMSNHRSKQIWFISPNQLYQRNYTYGIIVLKTTVYKTYRVQVLT